MLPMLVNKQAAASSTRSPVTDCCQREEMRPAAAVACAPTRFLKIQNYTLATQSTADPQM